MSKTSGLETLKETSLKLNLPSFTKTVAVSIFKRASTNQSITVNNMKRLSLACISLSCKITEFPVDRKNTVDGNLEMKIAEGMNFEFDPFDIYAFMKIVYASINIDMMGKLEEKIEEEDCIFDREKCIEVGLGLIKEEDMERFKSIHCIL